MPEGCLYKDLKPIWKDNNKMNFKGIGWDGVEWIHLGLGCGQVAGSCEHGNEYSDSEKKSEKFHG